jgi:hypothetical protein
VGEVRNQQAGSLPLAQVDDTKAIASRLPRSRRPRTIPIIARCRRISARANAATDLAIGRKDAATIERHP